MKTPALQVLLTAAILIPVVVYAQPRPGNPTTPTLALVILDYGPFNGIRLNEGGRV